MRVFNESERALRSNAWVLMGALVVAFAVSLGFAFASDSGAAVIASFVFLLLAGGVALKRRVSLMSPFTFIVIGAALTYGARPLYLALSDQPVSFAPSIDPQTLAPAAGLALVFTALMLVGYFSRIGQGLGRRLPTLFSPMWSVRRTVPVAMGVALVGVIALVAMFRTQGLDVSAIWAESSQLRRATSNERAYYITYLSSWCCWAVFYLLFIRALTSGFTLRRISILSTVFVLCAVVSMAYGTRSALLWPILGVFWLWDLTRGSLRLQRVLPFLLFAFAWVTIGGVWREADALGVPVEERMSMAQEVDASDLAQTAFGRFDFFDFWTFALDNFHLKEPDYYWGKSYADFLVQPIPRSIWRDKPYKISASLVRALMLKNVDLDTITTTPEWGLITESYVNFGVIGVALGALLLGLLVRAHETYAETNRLNASVLFLNVQVFMATFAWLLGGFASEMTQMMLMNLVLSSAVLFFVARRAPRAGYFVAHG